MQIHTYIATDAHTTPQFRTSLISHLTVIKFKMYAQNKFPAMLHIIEKRRNRKIWKQERKGN